MSGPASAPNAAQRRNLLKLAAYLESLPRIYRHFDMSNFAEHRGNCDLPDAAEVLAATKPEFFLNNCGTVACALGHGPAAGIKVPPTALYKRAGTIIGVNWGRYSDETLGIGDNNDWEFLFGGSWDLADNHHYGAAARIRYFLANGDVPADFDCYESDLNDVLSTYAPYRKGSRSKIRRQIEQVSA